MRMLEDAALRWNTLSVPMASKLPCTGMHVLHCMAAIEYCGSTCLPWPEDVGLSNRLHLLLGCQIGSVCS